MKIQKLMQLHRLYREPAGEHGSDEGGTGVTPEAAAAAAAKVIADAKVVSDAAAAAAAAAGTPAAKTTPTDAEAELLKDVMKQKARATALAAEVDALKAAAKSFEGIDPVKVRALLAEQATAETAALEAKGEYGRLKEQMATAHAAEKATLQTTIDAQAGVTNGLNRQIAELTVGSAFGTSVLVKDELTLTPAKARVIYGTHFEFKDGKVVGFDKPAGASERTLLVGAAGDALSFEDALRKIVDADPDKDQLYRSKVKAGAGSGTNLKGTKQPVADVDTSLKGIGNIAAGLKAKAALAK